MRNEANHSKHYKCKVTFANLSHVYMRDSIVPRRGRARHDKTEKSACDKTEKKCVQLDSVKKPSSATL